MKRFVSSISNSSKIAVSDIKSGSNIHGFEVKRVTDVPELRLSAIELTHAKTGAQFFHIDRQDPNNVFSVSFKTTPWDSTGVSHILEHTVLCGSKEFPVRDPFFKMLNRSVATYMNAWTASDFTMYPFSSVVWADLENLRRVYLDACFFPLLKKTDFQQEGWRVENVDLNDIKSPLQFKGVVYNEMKGAFSDVGSLYCTRLQQHLMPNSTYGFVSGGEPQKITDLTHEQLAQFHRKHYHPSNARFYTYGEYPLEKHLEYVNSVLSQFDRIDPPSVKTVPDKITNKKVVEFCPPDAFGDANKQAKVSVSFVLNDTRDSYETFVMRILSYLLINGQASPMYQALIKSNIGSEYSPGSGYDDSTQVATFSVGLQGVAEVDAPKVEQIIKKELEKASVEGFPKSRIDAAIHQIELSIKHRTANFGLGLAQGLMSTWIHGGEPLEVLQVNANLKRLSKDLQNPEFLKKKVKEFFLQNDGKLVMIMKPDQGYNERLVKEETERLENLTLKFTPEDRQRIFEENIKLAQSQDSKPNLSCLPCLKVEDMPREVKRTSLKHLNVSNIPLQMRVSPTNDISYFRLMTTFDGLPLRLRNYLPLFTSALTGLGTNDKSDAEFDEEIRLNTGGIGASTFLSTNHSDLMQFQQGIAFGGNSLDRNWSHLLRLLKESMVDCNFLDTKKLKTLILQQASGLMNSVADSGHMYARKLAASQLSPVLKYSEVYGGLTQVEWMNKLSTEGELEEISTCLKDISFFLQAKGVNRASLTVSSDQVFAEHESSLKKFFENSISNKPQDNDNPFSSETNFTPRFGLHHWIATPFVTNFAASCYPTVPFTHPDAASLRILASLLSHQYLHKEIREKNGAYGGGASYSHVDGVFAFYSYRDPNPLNSIDSFRKAIEWSLNNEFTKQQIDESKLSILGQMDAPVSAASEGMRFFNDRITDSMMQEYRNAIFKVDLQDLRRVARDYLFDQIDKGSTVVIASENTPNTSSSKSDWEFKKLK